MPQPIASMVYGNDVFMDILVLPDSFFYIG